MMRMYITACIGVNIHPQCSHWSLLTSTPLDWNLMSRQYYVYVWLAGRQLIGWTVYVVMYDYNYIGIVLLRQQVIMRDATNSSILSILPCFPSSNTLTQPVPLYWSNGTSSHFRDSFPIIIFWLIRACIYGSYALILCTLWFLNIQLAARICKQLISHWKHDWLSLQ